MVTSLAFRRTFTIALAVGVIESALPPSVAEKTLYAGFWIGYLLVAAFGFLATWEGQRYRHVFTYTWAFVALWFVLGVLNFILGRGDVPVDWSPEKDRLAFQGYLLATVLFLPVAFAASALGAAIAHLFARFRREPPHAA
jgi:hypothetical protein